MPRQIARGGGDAGTRWRIRDAETDRPCWEGGGGARARACWGHDGKKWQARKICDFPTATSPKPHITTLRPHTAPHLPPSTLLPRRASGTRAKKAGTIHAATNIRPRQFVGIPVARSQTQIRHHGPARAPPPPRRCCCCCCCYRGIVLLLLPLLLLPGPLGPPLVRRCRRRLRPGRPRLLRHARRQPPLLQRDPLVRLLQRLLVQGPLGRRLRRGRDGRRRPGRLRGHRLHLRPPLLPLGRLCHRLRLHLRLRPGQPGRLRRPLPLLLPPGPARHEPLRGEAGDGLDRLHLPRLRRPRFRAEPRPQHFDVEWPLLRPLQLGRRHGRPGGLRRRLLRRRRLRPRRRPLPARPVPQLRPRRRPRRPRRLLRQGHGVLDRGRLGHRHLSPARLCALLRPRRRLGLHGHGRRLGQRHARLLWRHERRQDRRHVPHNVGLPDR
jgi:hypothetical protein